MSSHAKYPYFSVSPPRDICRRFAAALEALDETYHDIFNDVIFQTIARAMLQKPQEYEAILERRRVNKEEIAAYRPADDKKWEHRDPVVKVGGQVQRKLPKEKKPVIDAEDLTEADDQGAPCLLTENNPEQG